MGTDLAPHPEVEGAVLAVQAGLAEVVLVGNEAQLKQELGRQKGSGKSSIEIVHASEAVRNGRQTRTVDSLKR